MLFNFQLRKIAHIQPWEEDGEPTLHWYGLTDGWYWLDLDGQEAFRYTDAILKHWGDEDRPYIDYYVARLWEDLIETLPYTLQPLSEALAERLTPLDDWLAWKANIEGWLLSLAEDEEDEAWRLYLQATSWWGARRYDTSYLDTAPDLWMWRIGEEVIVRWASRGETIEGIPVWACEQQQITLSVEDFVSDAQTFDRMLMNDMSFREKGARKNWKRKDVELDTDLLMAEQKERETWLKKALAAEPGDITDDWDAVQAAIEQLEALVGS